MTPSERNADPLGQAINSACDAELTVHPSQWELDERGAPVWLAALVPSGGPGWYFVDAEPSALLSHPPDGVPQRFAMPQLDKSMWDRLRPPPTPPRRGPRGLQEAQPEVCCRAAWLKDVEEISLAEIAREDYVPSPGGRASPDLRNLRRRAQRRVVAGRELMNREGVLPWMLWSSGEVPDGWWQRPNFRVVLEVWTRYNTTLSAVVEQIHHLLEEGMRKENRLIEEETTRLLDWAEAELARTRRGSPGGS